VKPSRLLLTFATLLAVSIVVPAGSHDDWHDGHDGSASNDIELT